MTTRFSILLVPITLLFSSALAQAASPRITIGTNVSEFIGNIQLADTFYEDARIIEARGYAADWQDAIAGEGTILDEGNNIRIIKIFSVPFSDSTGIRHSSIIGGILQARNSIQSHEFITIVDHVDRPEISKISIAIIGQDTGIEPLIQAIQTGSRSSIWNIILRGSIPAKSIVAAFERSGIACDSAPIWFPEKSIWYAATCIPDKQ
jgi:hypothetical protein